MSKRSELVRALTLPFCLGALLFSATSAYAESTPGSNADFNSREAAAAALKKPALSPLDYGVVLTINTDGDVSGKIVAKDQWTDHNLDIVLSINKAGQLDAKLRDVSMRKVVSTVTGIPQLFEKDPPQSSCEPFCSVGGSRSGTSTNNGQGGSNTGSGSATGSGVDDQSYIADDTDDGTFFGWYDGSDDGSSSDDGSGSGAGSGSGSSDSGHFWDGWGWDVDKGSSGSSSGDSGGECGWGDVSDRCQGGGSGSSGGERTCNGGADSGDDCENPPPSCSDSGSLDDCDGSSDSGSSDGGSSGSSTDDDSWGWDVDDDSGSDDDSGDDDSGDDSWGWDVDEYCPPDLDSCGGGSGVDPRVSGLAGPKSPGPRDPCVVSFTTPDSGGQCGSAKGVSSTPLAGVTHGSSTPSASGSQAPGCSSPIAQYGPDGVCLDRSALENVKVSRPANIAGGVTDCTMRGDQDGGCTQPAAPITRDPKNPMIANPTRN